MTFLIWLDMQCMVWWGCQGATGAMRDDDPARVLRMHYFRYAPAKWAQRHYEIIIAD